MRPIGHVNTMKEAPKPLMAQPRSPWHSPVPYLFGGLAAMLGLIAFALFILACSYRRTPNNDGGEETDVESSDSVKEVKVYEEKILVIMAGELKPTFLATPVSNKAPSFGDKNGGFVGEQGSEKGGSGEKVKPNMSSDDNHQRLPTTITENSADPVNNETGQIQHQN
ncbi:hypothetical protein ERO13_D06G106200v2 [Gossypium hirsutum]|uniref:Protein GLUTAMINE DUMPER 5 n=4 Tax=Gossypium TaxID=3633 RepID=A0A1U8IYN9_GOSHI|nr:protein GLUTAMINE DUMPER 5-like [Gossypium hirsutum]KAB2024979.1 hypothetical protein ES319_D06G122500v1 [Gossypium barbadense]TYH66580.1 hypothetical protein ES332_D06G133900v1 [Gossypium tomentosum]TYI77120.1 hypothetical protein E1A91_D06G124300v1 [Gossypium mustelinum]KAG4141975.1 hypothetical protein ERO13_D06G106200v2 [Gossypium hirsutum]PPD89649.1 hypothetical protein GOBAR_DD13407 [Gossypium barbadense]